MDLRHFICGMDDDELVEALSATVPRDILIQAARATDCPSTWRGQKCIEVVGHDGLHRSMWEGTRWRDESR